MSQQSIHDRIMSRDATPTEVSETAKVSSQSKKGWRRIIFGVALAALVLGGGGFAAFQFPAVVDVFAQGATGKAAKPTAKLPETLFLEHVKQAGINTCGTVFPVLGQLLVNGAEYNVRTQWHDAEPNNHSVQALVGMNYATSDYSGSAAGVVFASPNGTTCEGSMVRIAPFSKKCTEIPTILPAGSTQASMLGAIPVYNVANNGGQVLLLPFDQSCIVISVAQAAAEQKESQ